MVEYTEAGWTSREKSMKLKYAVVYERTPNNYGAYAPDLPGCISTGKTWDEMQEMMREAIEFHIEGMMEDGDPIPKPRMSIGDAMAYHLQLIAEVGESASDLETTFGMVEIEISPPQAVAGASERHVSSSD